MVFFSVILGLLLPLSVVGIIIFLFLNMKNVSIMKFYLALASFAGLMGSIIGFGVLSYETIRRWVISDDEYIQGTRSYEMQSCENTGVNGMYEVKEPTATAKKPTQTEIDTCKFQVRERIIKERAYQTKDSMIGGGVWGSLFLIIFILHFPAFIRNARKEDGGE